MKKKVLKTLLVFSLLFSLLCIFETVARKTQIEVQKEAVYVSVYKHNFIIKR